MFRLFTVEEKKTKLTHFHQKIIFKCQGFKTVTTVELKLTLMNHLISKKPIYFVRNKYSSMETNTMFFYTFFFQITCESQRN